MGKTRIGSIGKSLYPWLSSKEKEQELILVIFVILEKLKSTKVSTWRHSHLDIHKCPSKYKYNSQLNTLQHSSISQTKIWSKRGLFGLLSTRFSEWRAKGTMPWKQASAIISNIYKELSHQLNKKFPLSYLVLHSKWLK